MIRADRLRQQILHWLNAMEQYHNLRNAPRRAFTSTRCSGGGGNHWTHVRLVPNSQTANRIACTAPRDMYPDAILSIRVLSPLREAGFEVGEPSNHRCGCATFTVWPRSRPGA